MKPKRRLAFHGGLLILLLIGVPGWVVGRAYRRERATHDLAIALYKNDTKSALAALSAGADPNARRFEHEIAPTPGQTLRRFLQQLRGGKTVSDSEPDHRPPMLALAAEKNNTAVVQALLKEGAVPDAQARYGKDEEYADEDDSTYGKTALMWAAEDDNVALAKALLNRGAKPDLTAGYWGEAPLLETKDPELMEALLAHGADIHVQLRHGKFAGITPLRWLLLNSVGEGVTTRHYRCLDVLLAHGANIDEDGDRTKSEDERSFFSTALEIVSRYGEPADVRYILMKGADKSGNKGTFALGEAIDDGMTGNIRVLLARGVDPNRRNEEGKTPLMLAIEQGEDEPVKALIAAGAKVNVRDKHGKTPLQLAEEDDNGTVADILRAAGARR